VPRTELATRATAEPGAATIRTSPPVVPAGIVARPRLLDRLRALSDTTVVAVCAPAGYGKTTLLAQWIREDERPAAWLSLAPADDDPAALLTSVALALDRQEDVGGDVFDALAAGPSAVVPLALPRLGRALAARSEPFVLVLDDVQYVASPRAVDTLRLLVDHLPPGSQLLLGSRAEPAFPVARLRVERRFAQLDPADLEMTPAEGTDLLHAAGVDLTRPDAEAVVAQTEGWAAALYLASLALRDPDGDGEHAAFGGRDRSLADYVREEVLASATPEQVAFLTRTAILTRLSAPLCDAVLERTDSDRVLRELADARLLVSPLDRRGDWYRVHQLFAETLAGELQRSEPALAPVLHRRASDWYLAQGDSESAIRHARDSGDVAHAADLMWLAAPYVVSGGRAASYMRWMEWFDREDVGRYPWLADGAGWCALESGDGDLARGWLAIAAAAPSETVVVDGAPLGAHVALLRAGLLQDGVRPLRQDGELALRLLPEDNVWRCLAHYFVGTGSHLLGDREAAVAPLERAERASAANVPAIHVLALGQQALLAVDADDWVRAASLVRRLRAHQRRYGLEDYASGAHVSAIAALVEAHSGDAGSARASARRATTVLATHRHFAPWAAAVARLMLARTHLILGDTTAARTMLAEARPELARVPDAVVLQELAADLRARVEGAGVGIPGGPSSLTTAELRVLQYLPTHMSFREIGEQLFVSRNTVKTHALSVYRKLDASSRSEAVERARALGILEAGITLTG
jgi:LuxR family transcriptional regulator, maltose regulon positive regulatory protein